MIFEEKSTIEEVEKELSLVGKDAELYAIGFAAADRVNPMDMAVVVIDAAQMAAIQEILLGND